MTRIKKRRIIDSLISILTCIVLMYAGAGFWALIVYPFGIWCFYDGMTRQELNSNDAWKLK